MLDSDTFQTGAGHRRYVAPARVRATLPACEERSVGRAPQEPRTELEHAADCDGPAEGGNQGAAG